MLQIDTDIPYPTERDLKDRNRCEPFYPWTSMAVGNSFLVNDRNQAASARSSLTRFKRLGRVPASYYTKSARDGDKIRVWLMDKTSA